MLLEKDFISNATDHNILQVYLSHSRPVNTRGSENPCVREHAHCYTSLSPHSFSLLVVESSWRTTAVSQQHLPYVVKRLCAINIASVLTNQNHFLCNQKKQYMPPSTRSLQLFFFFFWQSVLHFILFQFTQCKITHSSCLTLQYLCWQLQNRNSKWEDNKDFASRYLAPLVQ